MSRTLLVLGLSLGLGVSIACKQTIVRDAQTYKNELAWNEAASMQLAQMQLRYAEKLSQDGNQDRCVEVAQFGLLGIVRLPYHKKMSLFLAGQGPDPGDPPAIEDAMKWCAERAHAPSSDLSATPSDMGARHEL